MASKLIAIKRRFIILRKVRHCRRLTKLWIIFNLLALGIVVCFLKDLTLVALSYQEATRHVRKLADWTSDGDQSETLHDDSSLAFRSCENQQESSEVKVLRDTRENDILNSEHDVIMDGNIWDVNKNRTGVHVPVAFGGPLKEVKGQLSAADSLKYLKKLNAESFCGMKKFLLFGMRPRWYQFCRSRATPQFRHLVQFPRVISCPLLNCKIIINHSEEPRDLAGYDVVIFTNVYEWLTSEMWDWVHGNRSDGQKWVMVTQESPFYVPGIRPPMKYGNVTYDWVDSYRRKSEFYHPYGWFKHFKVPRDWNINVTNFMSRKTSLMAWMSSHCETLHWDRQMFVKDLGAMVEIDTFGKCGEKELRWNKERIYTSVFTKYKFYLSLENSCCDEYITEKFWRSLKLGILPIVVGAPYEHYLRVAPPNSFLHVDMFDSMNELVSHIRELDSNDEKYIDYFRWRTMGQLTSRPSAEHFLLPLGNKTHCSILTKYLRSDLEGDKKLDYYSRDWHGSCSTCSRKGWIKKYMLKENHARVNKDIWA